MEQMRWVFEVGVKCLWFWVACRFALLEFNSLQLIDSEKIDEHRGQVISIPPAPRGDIVLYQSVERISKVAVNNHMSSHQKPKLQKHKIPRSLSAMSRSFRPQGNKQYEDHGSDNSRQETYLHAMRSAIDIDVSNRMSKVMCDIDWRLGRMGM